MNTLVIGALLSALAASPPAEARDDALAGAAAGLVGGLVGAASGAAVLGGGFFATGAYISSQDCAGGCTDSEGMGYIYLSPVAAGLGAVVGGLVGIGVGIGLFVGSRPPPRPAPGLPLEAAPPPAAIDDEGP